MRAGVGGRGAREVRPLQGGSKTCVGYKKKIPAKGPRLALCGDSNVRSVVELQSELDLPRIVRSIAGRADFAEALVCEVAGAGNRTDTVATEVRGIEIGMVKDVEDFRTELQMVTLRETELLEEGKIEPVESGPFYLRYSTQSVGASQRYASSN